MVKIDMTVVPMKPLSLLSTKLIEVAIDSTTLYNAFEVVVCLAMPDEINCFLCTQDFSTQ